MTVYRLNPSSNTTRPDLENASAASCGTTLITCKARGNASHVFVVSIVRACGLRRRCLLACEGGDKGERVLSLAHSCVETLDSSDAVGRRECAARMCTHGVKIAASAHRHTHTHRSTQAQSGTRLVGHAGSRRSSGEDFTDFTVNVQKINYAHT